MHAINNGEIGAHLLKPMNFFTYWLGIDLGRALGSFLIRSLPLFLIFTLFYNITLPDSLLQWLAFLLSIILSGTDQLRMAIPGEFGGFLVPQCHRNWAVCLWPELDLFGLLHATGSLSGLAGKFHPIDAIWRKCLSSHRDLHQNLNGFELLQIVLIQISWAIFFIIFDQLVLSRGVRKLVIQGG